eukprot:CAMPEP_0174853182 /NCGR_PEP_ID=MMETSP1114-20130205/27402_1 /TAXON_ID=312471 /ORGANISM="Neobodo designis, Strain CCAP 1951/1" /LENGTH=125 /DNA_ID=CAMNT_0016087803 /DNA_START=18 /DNA_END=396 /DNA_ORIENTATION=+
MINGGATAAEETKGVWECGPNGATPWCLVEFLSQASAASEVPQRESPTAQHGQARRAHDGTEAAKQRNQERDDRPPPDTPSQQEYCSNQPQVTLHKLRYSSGADEDVDVCRVVDSELTVGAPDHD